MKTISRDVARFNLLVALLSVAVFIIVMPNELLNAAVLLGAYLPYALFSYILGLRFGGWYLADGETPRIFEFVGVPILLISLILYILIFRIWKRNFFSFKSHSEAAI